MTTLVITLLVYKFLLIGIGFWASRRSTTSEDFHLAGRNLGPWVASLSSAASSSSAWSLLGVSGSAYVWGFSAVWLIPACLFGFCLNWFFVADRLRRLSEKSQAVTLVEIFSNDAPARLRKVIILLSAFVILSSLSIYIASQFKAAGVTFSEILDMPTNYSVLVGGSIVIAYTMIGGFWAVSVTDFFQGIIMALASILLPLVAFIEVGYWDGLVEGLRQANDPILLDVFRGKIGFSLAGFLIGIFGIGLGYPGQPHVVNRFMAMRSSQDVARGTWISLAWGVIIYSGMVILGLSGRGLAPHIDNPEAILLVLSNSLFSPVVAGILIAAVLSAIMSTADSQLLVCSSVISRDCFGRESRFLDRLTIFCVGFLSISAAMLVEQTIFDSVLFAWGALGAAFGPLLLVRLLKGPVHPVSVIFAIGSGFFIALFWHFFSSLRQFIDGLVPAFIVSGLFALHGARIGIDSQRLFLKKGTDE